MEQKFTGSGLRRTSSTSEVNSSWWEIQNKVFATWVQTKLATRPDSSSITREDAQQIETFYCDGVQLCRLVEVLSGKTVKYATGVANKHGMVANIIVALELIQQEGIKLVNIGAQDVVDGKKDLLMGLLWNLMQKYQLYDKASLLKWCQETIAPFGLTVTNFTDSWSDGKAFNALVCALAPSAVDMGAVANAEPEANLELAFRVAEEALKIPQLLEPHYLTQTQVWEGMERIVILYVSYFWKAQKLPKVDKTLQKPREPAHILLIRKHLETLQGTIIGVLQRLSEEDTQELIETAMRLGEEAAIEEFQGNKDADLVHSLGIMRLQFLTESVQAKAQDCKRITKELKFDITELENAKAEEIRLKEELHDKNVKLEEVIKGLNGDKEELHKQNNTVMQQLSESVEKSYQQQNEIEELKGEISKLQDNLKGKEESLHKLEEEAEDMRQKLKERKALQDALEKAIHDSEVLVQQYKDLEKSLTETVQSNQRMANQVIALKLQIEVANQALLPTGKIAPTGDVSLAVSSIQDATTLWEVDSISMAKASGIYNSLLRGLLDKHEGYEVSNENGIFTATFSSALDAASWAMAVQLELLNSKWPETLLDHKSCEKETDGDGNVLYAGLRVKTGLHWGQPTCAEDEVSKKTSYFGPVVDKTHAISWLPSCGGQVVCSEVFSDQISSKLDLITGDPSKTELGYMPLKGFNDETAIFQLVPARLKNRKFAPVKPEAGPAAQKLADQLKLMEEMNQALTEQIMHIEKAAKDASERADKLSSALRVMYTEFCDSASKKEKLKLLMQQLNDLNKNQEQLHDDLEASREASQKATGAMKDVESRIDTVAMDVRQLMSKKLQELEMEKRDITEKYMAVTEELSNAKGHCYELVLEKNSVIKEFQKKHAEVEAALSTFRLVSQNMNSMVSDFSKKVLGEEPVDEGTETN